MISYEATSSDVSLSTKFLRQLKKHKTSNEIEELRQRIEEIAQQRFGQRWKRGLARAAGWNERTLEQLFYRGKRLPSADKLAAIERALGLAGISSPLLMREVAPEYVARLQAAPVTTDLPYLAQIQRRIEKLFHRTRGQEKDWIIFERILDSVEPPRDQEAVQRERYWAALREGKR